MKRMRDALWPLAIAALLLACGQRNAGDPPSPSPQADPPRTSVRAAHAAPARVTRAELIERLRMPLSRSTEGLTFERHGQHGVRLRLQGRAQHAVLARVDADGRLRMSCVDSPQAAERALAGPAVSR